MTLPAPASNLAQRRVRGRNKSQSQLSRRQRQKQDRIGESQVDGDKLMDWTRIANLMANILNQNKLQTEQRATRSF